MDEIQPKGNGRIVHVVLFFCVGLMLLSLCLYIKRAETGDCIKMIEYKSEKWTPCLSDVEKATLLAIAEDTLKWCVEDGREDFSFDKYDITQKLKIETHTFVTLKVAGMLRGCIGSLPPSSAAELYLSVHENAVSSALDDPRFRQVTVNEISDIDIHVSILSPVKDILSLDEFKIGEHGIILIKGTCRAVYLPEVAIEQGWDKEQTLVSLSNKAGLNDDAWREGAQFKVFSSVGLPEE